MTTNSPDGRAPDNPTGSSYGGYPVNGSPSPMYQTPGGAPQQPAPAPKKPARSGFTTILLLLVTLLLGVIIGLLLNRTVLNPEPSAEGTGSPTEEATDPAADPSTEEPDTDQAAEPQPPADPSDYPDAPDDELLALIEAQFRRDPDDATATGAVDAPVVVAEWADFRCSYCGKFALETLPEIQHFIDDGLVRVEWNDFPVFQEESVDLAVAAHAAGNQGLFREFSHAIFEYQFVEGGSDLSRENIIAVAESVGVPDIETFTSDLDSEEILTKVNDSYDNAMSLFGQAATPKFLVSTQYLGGFLDGDSFSIVIEQELQRIADNG